MNRIFVLFGFEMDLGYALLRGLLVELVDLGLAVAGYFALPDLCQYVE
jgi:hypothetical protein